MWLRWKNSDTIKSESLPRVLTPFCVFLPLATVHCVHTALSVFCPQTTVSWEWWLFLGHSWKRNSVHTCCSSLLCDLAANLLCFSVFIGKTGLVLTLWDGWEGETRMVGLRAWTCSWCRLTTHTSSCWCLLGLRSPHFVYMELSSQGNYTDGPQK